jgi:hypothetical protein
MRIVNCYSRSVLGPSSLPYRFTELFEMDVKEPDTFFTDPQQTQPSSQSSNVPGFGDL